MKDEKLHRVVITEGQPIPEEVIREVEEASRRPIVFDEDCPELTEEQLSEMAALAREQRAARAKPVISLRISPSTLAKAKATGKGYTGFLSRLLDNAINDPELVRKSL